MIILLKIILYIYLAVFGAIWITAIGFTWYESGFSAVQQLLSPFNIMNYIVTLIMISPAVGLHVMIDKLEAKRDEAT